MEEIFNNQLDIKVRHFSIVFTVVNKPLKLKRLNLKKSYKSKVLFEFMLNSNKTKQKLDKIIVLEYIEVKSW